MCLHESRAGCRRGDGLEHREQNGNDNAGDEAGGDEELVADVAVGHVEASDGRGEQADGYEEEEDLHGE